MAALDRSAVVAALKLILPLVALALLSMVFLLASPVDPSRALETATIDVADRARDPRLSAARFAGVTDDGTAIRLEAGAARSDPGAALRFQAEALVLRLDGADGRTLTARADSGLIDRAAGRFAMQGDIRIEQGPDLAVQVAALDGALDRTRVLAEGPVRGRLRSAELEAGRLIVTAEPGPGGRLQLVFRDGVRLIYPTTD
jgi:lipopolysaccharide export system protein LptC